MQKVQYNLRGGTPNPANFFPGLSWEDAEGGRIKKGLTATDKRERENVPCLSSSPPRPLSWRQSPTEAESVARSEGRKRREKCEKKQRQRVSDALSSVQRKNVRDTTALFSGLGLESSPSESDKLSLLRQKALSLPIAHEPHCRHRKERSDQRTEESRGCPAWLPSAAAGRWARTTSSSPPPSSSSST